MEACENLNKLRLAARALIEWRTPPPARIYQMVLADLVRRHPARQLMESHNGVFGLDDDGTLLWYLSETLDANPSDFSGTGGCSSDVLMASAYDELVRKAVVEKDSASQVWPGGPSTDRLADAIEGALTGKAEPPTELGIRSLVAVAVPWPISTTRNLVNALMATYKPASGFVQRLKVRVRASAAFLQWANLIVGILSMAYMLYTSSLLFGVAPIRMPSAHLQFLPIFIAGLAGTFTYIIVTHKVQTRELIARLLEGPDRTGWDTPGSKLSLSRFGDYSDLSCRSLAHPCGYEPGVMASMLKYPGAQWGKLALSCTHVAAPEVIREVLHVLRLPETDKGLRAEIFQWLCQVAVLSRDAQSLDEPSGYHD